MLELGSRQVGKMPPPILFTPSPSFILMGDRSSRTHDSVDFHGVNVINATIIIQEILQKQKSSISQGRFLDNALSWFNPAQPSSPFLSMSCLLSWSLLLLFCCIPVP